MIQSKKQIMTLKYQQSKEHTTSDYNKVTKEIIDARIKQKELISKSDNSNLVKDFDLNKTWNISNKTRVKSRVR